MSDIQREARELLDQWRDVPKNTNLRRAVTLVRELLAEYEEMGTSRDNWKGTCLIRESELEEAQALAAWFAAKSRWLTSKSEHYLRRREAEAALDRVRALADKWDDDARYAWEELGVMDRMTLRKAVVELCHAIDGEGQP